MRNVQDVYKREGMAGFYAGLESALFGIALTNGVYYYWYEYTKSFLTALSSAKSGPSSAKSALTAWQSFVAGSVAGIACVLITNPVWVVNTRISLAGSSSVTGDEDFASSDNIAPVDERKKSSIEVMLQMVKEEGLLSLWQGVWPALVLVSNPAIQHMVFEQLKQRLIRLRLSQIGNPIAISAGDALLGGMDYFVLGALSKVVATVLTYPYIVIKARMQAKHSSHKQQGIAAKEKSMVEMMSRIVQREGFAGLYRGVGLKLYQSVLTAAILFGSKEPLVRITRDGMLFLMTLISSGLANQNRPPASAQ